MTRGKTHYDVLGLARDAAAEDIEANYRLKLAQLKGRAGVSAADVMALRAAHQVLAEPTRRAEYDRSLAPPPRERAVFAPTTPKPPELDRSFWQSTPALLLGVAVLAGVGAWGWSNWQKRAAPAQRVAAPRPAQPAAPRKPPAPVAAAAPAATPAMAPPTTAPAASAANVSQRVLAAASPGVVRVHVHDASGKVRHGSGVAIEGGKVVTTCTLVKGGASFEMHRGALASGGTVVAGDDAIDLCVIQAASSAFGSAAAPSGNAYALRAGDRAYAIGIPKGQVPAVAEGPVSALPDTPEGPMIRLGAAVPPGFEGAGLFGADGKLLGIVTRTSGLAVPVDRIAGLPPRAAARTPKPAAGAR